MNVLLGCERSGKTREEFRALGHNVWSCDTEPAEDGSPFHYQADIFTLLRPPPTVWDLFIVHPPCTFLSVSGLHWNLRVPGRLAKTAEALAFVARLFVWAKLAKIKMVLENPVGCINTFLADAPTPQYVQPYMFGDDASKKTGLWLVNCEPLVIPAKALWYPPRRVMWNGKWVERWSNQTDSGQSNLPEHHDRARKRSETYPGIARAFATQYGRAT